MNTKKELTGYPSIDKPWLKYYSDEAINAKLSDRSMYSNFCELNQSKSKDDISLKYFNSKYTYGQLMSMIDKTAGAFVSIGVRKGDIVSLALPNIPENIFCIYALNKIGAIANLVDLRSKGDILSHYLSEAESKFAVVCSLFLTNTLEIINQTSVEKLIVVSPVESLSFPFRIAYSLKNHAQMKGKKIISWRSFLSQSITTKTIQMSEDDVACIFHTSGTTGVPKGVMLPNKCFNAIALQFDDCGIPHKDCDSYLNQVPPFLAYHAVAAMNIPLCLHMTIRLLPDYRPDRFAENILKYKPNHVTAGPADYTNFLNKHISNADFSFVKSMACGSDKMLSKVKNQVNELLLSNNSKYPILEGYGLTEVGSVACIDLPQCNHSNSVGIPLPLINICIYDNEKNTEMEYGMSGEICISGPTLMTGYYNMPEATSDVLKQHDGKTWIHTGDLGLITKDGCLFLEGRIKRIIIRFDGFKISPFDVEKIILKNDKIRECCCVGKFDIEHNSGQIPIVYVVKNNGVNMNDKELKEELLNQCKNNLSERYIPRDIYIIDHLPMTSNGKVDYRALEKMAEEMEYGNE